jgi:hypothetical protein
MNFGNVGSLVWKGKKARVQVQKLGSFLIIALAEEVGFANGFVGERHFERRR